MVRVGVLLQILKPSMVCVPRSHYTEIDTDKGWLQGVGSAISHDANRPKGLGSATIRIMLYNIDAENTSLHIVCGVIG